jgi:hypothetical protein
LRYARDPPLSSSKPSNMTALYDVDDRQRAELVRKKTEACLVCIVFGDAETQQSITTVGQHADGNRIE